jgi:flavin reductase (DIM6/NTAB) family NADH-FMN oxidoreductase RutF
VTIHASHPFADPDDPVRRFRGRVGGRVTLWTSGVGAARAGLTVSSVLVAAGEPAAVLALLDPDSDLAGRLRTTGTAVAQLLEWRHRDLAEAFAGRLPAPGGAFRMSRFEDTPWGPLLADAPGWAGLELSDARPVGWSLLVETVVRSLVVGDEDEPLVHRRGRYERPPGP